MSVTQILRDIRAGVLVGSSHISSPGGGGASSRQAASSAASHPDDTYMYDDEMSRLGQQHWYDEPPYESDPEDFLMQADPSPPAAVTLHNSRFCISSFYFYLLISFFNLTLHIFKFFLNCGSTE